MLQTANNNNLLGISHPLVSSLQMKRYMGNGRKSENVLVIKTNFAEPDDDHTMFDTYLMDLLGDLEDLKNEAETQVGKFDRVDIHVGTSITA